MTLSDEEFSFLIRKVLEIQPLEVVEQGETPALEEQEAPHPKSERRHRYSLEELVEGSIETEEELNWGQPAGAEVW